MAPNDETLALRAKCRRFRILVIGRANAGKTTILKAICGSTDNGKVVPSSGRGEHNINDELVFSSNEGFVFHDSCGFEAGSTEEVTAMQEFLLERATARSLDEKLHAIWYCIPTDNARLLTAAELTFFDECNPNGVPVILIFTKFDALDSISFAELGREGKSLEEAEAEAPEHAQETFKNKQLLRFENRKYPAKGVAYLRNMHEEGQAKQCSKIIQLTTDNLGNETLQLLLISVQKVNLGLCVKYALESSSTKNILQDYTQEVSLQGRGGGSITQNGVWWFLQHLQGFKRQHDTWPKIVLTEISQWFPHIWLAAAAAAYDHAAAYAYDYRHAADAAYYRAAADALNGLKMPHKAAYLSKHLSLSHHFHPLYWSVCATIIAEHSFWLYIQSSRRVTLAHALKASIKRYKKLHIATSVAESIYQAFGHHATSNILSDDYYPSTSIQLVQIAIDHLICT